MKRRRIVRKALPWAGQIHQFPMPLWTDFCKFAVTPRPVFRKFTVTPRPVLRKFTVTPRPVFRKFTVTPRPVLDSVNYFCFMGKTPRSIPNKM